jgi:hypothetical protein
MTWGESARRKWFGQYDCLLAGWYARIDHTAPVMPLFCRSERDEQAFKAGTEDYLEVTTGRAWNSLGTLWELSGNCLQITTTRAGGVIPAERLL